MKWTGSYDKCHIDHIDKKRWLFAMYTICFGIMVMLVLEGFYIMENLLSEVQMDYPR